LGSFARRVPEDGVPVVAPGDASGACPPGERAGRRLVVLDPGEVDDGLVRDMTEVLACFCVRLYGRRSARNRAEKALRCAARDVGPAAVLSGDERRPAR
jgi:hypothetical protein